jgi:putative membrane protein insertion efficiency factor
MFRAAIRGVIHFVRTIIETALILLVKGYQYLIRPLLPPSCIYEPGCSEYMILAIKKYGPIKGVLKGCWRICRCHPYNAGGYDPP